MNLRTSPRRIVPSEPRSAASGPDSCLRHSPDSLPLDMAIACLRAASPHRPDVNVPLIQALDQTLAATLMAPDAFPPFDRAMMDGFAARFEDIPARQPLHILNPIPVGCAPSASLAPGTVLPVVTGAALPPGADCVIRKEYACVAGERLTTCTELLQPGKDCIRRGEDAVPGQPLIPAGTRVQPAHLSLAARHGVHTLAIKRPWRIRILLIGDELVAPGSPPQPGRVFEHNRILIEGFLTQLRQTPLPDNDILPDQETAIRHAVQAALSAATPPDMILLVGGTSVGAHDHTRAALDPLGSWLFHGIDVRPGRTACAMRTVEGVPVIALPGSPKAVQHLLTHLVHPLIAVPAGH